MKYLIMLITVAISLELFAMNSNEHYALSTEYYALSADEKRKYLWKNIQSSSYKTLPALTWQGFVPFLIDLDRYLKKNRSTADDVRPERQNRIMFVHGTVAKVRFIKTYTGYNGIFESDAIALMRCSLFADPAATGSYIPFMSIRFFIDESPGVTAGFMHSFQGQGKNHNWFERPLSNVISPSAFPYSLIDSKLAKAFSRPNHMPISHLAKRKINGRLCFETRAPYELILEPHANLRNFIIPQTLRDFREELGRLRPGITLYDVKAVDVRGGAVFTIGHIKLESEFIASDYGDTRIAF